MILGLEEAQIVKAIDHGLSDINSIHLITGIPVSCIERKVSALADLGIVKFTRAGYKIREDKLKLLGRIDGAKT